MTARNEVTNLRLYVKVPGTDQLRKSAAAELRTMLANGWHETDRRMAADHLNVRVERPVVKPGRMMDGAGPRRPR